MRLRFVPSTLLLKMLPGVMVRMWVAPLVVAAFGARLATGGEVPVVSFQVSGQASEESSLIWKGNVPEMKEFSICLRVRILQVRDYDVLVSYSVPDFDNEMYIGLNYNDQVLQADCCKRNVSKKVPVKVLLRQWMSFCLVMDITSNAFVAVIDNKITREQLQGDMSSEYVRVRGGGLFYVGQEQDLHGGGLNKRQSLRADLADYMVLDKALSEDAMRRFTLCQDVAEIGTPIIHMNNVEGDFAVGEDITANATVVREEMCLSKESYTIYFPEKRTFLQSSRVCHAVAGQVYIPEDEETNWQLFYRSQPFEDVCKSDSTDTTWVGSKYDATQNMLVSYRTRRRLSFSKFVSQPSKEKTCASMYTSLNDAEFWFGKWKPKDCDTVMCVCCQVTKVHLMRLRGLCSRSLFDGSYFLYGEVNGKPVFNGLRYSIIQWVTAPDDPATGHWELSVVGQRETRGRMKVTSKAEYPMGIKEWILEGDECPSTTTKLAITTCGPGEYTCRDGTCVAISHRCDLALHCPDGSDESGCESLVLPPGYMSNIPPPKTDDSPVQVLMTVVLGPIRAFEIIKFKMTLDMTVIFTWYDSRIKFQNLKGKEDLNKIDTGLDVPWTPRVGYFGAGNASSDVTPRYLELMAQKKSNPLPDDVQNVSEDEIYLGSENPLLLKQRATIEVTCEFDLSFYPFDTQRCLIEAVLEGVTAQYVVLTKEGSGVSYRGERRLLEYQVRQVEMHDSKGDGDRSGKTVTITLDNLYMYYVSSTYIPTFLLIFIGMLTFFFPLDDFNDRIMVSLTSLLVLAALFTQVSASIPKTSYLKLVDVWFIFCICIVFSVVATLTAINYFKRSPKVSPLVVVKPAMQPTTDNKITNASISAINRLCQLTFPVIALLFTVAYFIVVASRRA